MTDCGGTLMRHLRTTARANAFKRMHAVDATANAPLRRLNRASGLHSAIYLGKSTQVDSSVTW